MGNLTANSQMLIAYTHNEANNVWLFPVEVKFRDWLSMQELIHQGLGWEVSILQCLPPHFQFSYNLVSFFPEIYTITQLFQIYFFKLFICEPHSNCMLLVLLAKCHNTYTLKHTLFHASL